MSPSRMPARKSRPLFSAIARMASWGSAHSVTRRRGVLSLLSIASPLHHETHDLNISRMRRKSLADQDCPVAQTLDVVGEWWSLLILRDAFRGIRRFEAFQESLGV